MRLPITPAVLFVFLALPLHSQETRPYAGEDRRDIKALSPGEIESYRTGAGMGFAKAAELNHYPGPRHVLDLAKEIGLSASQRKEAQRIYDAMRAQTVGLGERLIVSERDLDSLFAAGNIDEASLSRSVREIARLQGEIRLDHLRAHLAMKTLLTPAQIAKYDELRGYGSGAVEHDPSRHAH
jgi:Spy/CpxP family protein refolding chaperone